MKIKLMSLFLTAPILVLGVVSCGKSANNYGELVEQINNLNNELSFLKMQITGMEESISNNNDLIKELQNENSDQQKEIDDKDREIHRLTTQITGMEESISQLNRQVSIAYERIDRLIAEVDRLLDGKSTSVVETIDYSSHLDAITHFGKITDLWSDGDHYQCSINGRVYNCLNSVHDTRDYSKLKVKIDYEVTSGNHFVDSITIPHDATQPLGNLFNNNVYYIGEPLKTVDPSIVYRDATPLIDIFTDNTFDHIDGRYNPASEREKLIAEIENYISNHLGYVYGQNITHIGVNEYIGGEVDKFINWLESKSMFKLHTI